MEPKQPDTMDFPFSNLNRQGAHGRFSYHNATGEWTGRNVYSEYPVNYFGGPNSEMNPHQASAIAVRTASVMTEAPSSTVKDGEEFFQRNLYRAITRDLEPNKFLSPLYSREVISLDDKEEIEARRSRKKQAELLMSKIQAKFHKATPNFKQALMYVVNDTFKHNQGHLAQYLNQKYIKPFEAYPPDVRQEIHMLMGQDSPLLKTYSRHNEALPEINIFSLSHTSHNGLNGNDRACEHGDANEVRGKSGTRESYPVQETGYDA